MRKIGGFGAFSAVCGAVRPAQCGSWRVWVDVAGGAWSGLAGLSVWWVSRGWCAQKIVRRAASRSVILASDDDVLQWCTAGRQHAARRPIFGLRRVLAGSDAQVPWQTVRRAGRGRPTRSVTAVAWAGAAEVRKIGGFCVVSAVCGAVRPAQCGSWRVLVGVAGGSWSRLIKKDVFTI